MKCLVTPGVRSDDAASLLISPRTNSFRPSQICLSPTNSYRPARICPSARVRSLAKSKRHRHSQTRGQELLPELQQTSLQSSWSPSHEQSAYLSRIAKQNS